MAKKAGRGVGRGVTKGVSGRVKSKPKATARAGGSKAGGAKAGGEKAGGEKVGKGNVGQANVRRSNVRRSNVRRASVRRAIVGKAKVRKAKAGKPKAAAQQAGGLAVKAVTKLRMWQVDAFASAVGRGNPAAVVVLDKAWLGDDVMQTIAAENNLSETAFVLMKGKKWGLRWFTPRLEVDLCGHATVATAHVLWRHLKLKSERLVFATQSGELSVTQGERGLIVLDFPSRPGEAMPVTPSICAALGHAPSELLRSPTMLMAVFENRRDVYGLDPDMRALLALEGLGIIVTAPGSGHDFVSRFFAPKAGVDEDPVTGSAHCTLVPYWSDRLGRAKLVGHQVSKRGGMLWCEDRGDRVSIAGHAVTYLEGAIRI